MLLVFGPCTYALIIFVASEQIQERALLELVAHDDIIWQTACPAASLINLQLAILKDEATHTKYETLP
jgi:hypothetical protein